MKDATTELRVAYLELLANIGLPVYDTITPPDAPTKYIIISNQNNVDRSPKCGFQKYHSIQLTTYTWYPVNNGSNKEAERIERAVIDAIYPTTTTWPVIPGYKVINTEVAMSRADTEFTKTEFIYKRITIFNHLIQEL